MPLDRTRDLAAAAAPFLAHEGEVRGWLRRALPAGWDADDVIQEAYCRFCAVEALGSVGNPRAYFFQTVRSVLVDQFRRARVVRIDSVPDLDSLKLQGDELSPERIASARWELQRVERLIAALPERCRRVVEMRKVQGLSQKEIAARLGVTEHVVENEAARGLRLILEALSEDPESAYGGPSHRKSRERFTRR